MTAPWTIVGRSSSHFTRVARIFALELAVEHAFEPVHDLRGLAAGNYGGNPALRMPVLKAGDDTWFGALNICRALARASAQPLRVVWPEQLTAPLLANAQELTVQAMGTAVDLIMSKDAAAPGSDFVGKRRASLENSVRWLDDRVDAVLAALPPRDLSYLEVTLFCLARHLAFREVLATAPFARLNAFCDIFEQRSSARATPFMFDT
jgi:glutathione S-transferase